MTDTLQVGYPMPDGSMKWDEPTTVEALDTKANLFRRWRDAKSFAAHRVVEIPCGVEIDAYLNNAELAGIRQRLVWDATICKPCGEPIAFDAEKHDGPDGEDIHASCCKNLQCKTNALEEVQR